MGAMAQLIGPMRVPWLADDTGIMSARSENEADRRFAQQMNLVDRPPRRDVIGLRSDGKNRDVDIRQSNGTPANAILTFGKVVLDEEMTQIFGMHAIGHAGRIGIPGHEIGHRHALAFEVLLDALRPDKIVGAKQLEGARHLPGVEIALLPHHVLEIGDLTVAEEKRELACLGEVRFRCQQRDRLQTIVVIARHCRRSDR